jgi:hypothetical protein
MEWVAAFVWNWWQLWTGIRTVHHKSHLMALFNIEHLFGGQAFLRTIYINDV